MFCECHFIPSDPRIVRAVQNPPNDFTTCNNKNFGATTQYNKVIESCRLTKYSLTNSGIKGGSGPNSRTTRCNKR